MGGWDRIVSNPLGERECLGSGRERKSRLARGGMNQTSLLLACIALCLAILVFDVHTPLGIVEWILYLLPLSLTFWFKDRRQIAFVGSLCILFMAIGFVLSPPGIAWHLALFNRTVGAGVISLVTIVSVQRKKMEEALRESEERYRSLFEDSPVSLWEEDFSDVKAYIDSLRKSGVEDLREYFEGHPEAVTRCAEIVKVLDVNRATLKLHQTGSKEELLSGVRLLLSGEPRGAFMEELIAIAEGKTVFDGEGITQTVTGREIDINFRFSIVPGYEETLSKVLVSVIDIADRKRAERELRESEKRLNYIIENLGAGLAVSDENRIYTYVNPARARMQDYTPEDMVGKPTYSFIHEDERPKLDVEQGKRIRGEASTYEADYISKDGRSIPVLVLSSPLFDENGRFSGSFAVTIDLTERKQMEEKLKEYTEQLEELVEERTRELRQAERMATIGETTAMIGHDLRNPLQAIVNYVALLRERSRAAPSIPSELGLEEFLTVLEERVIYMNKIVSDLQDYARPVKLELVETDLRGLIEDTLSAMGIPRNVDVSVNIGEDSFLKLDPELMKRVLNNLVLNALQAMPEGGRLTISSTRTEETVSISVQDTGVGIPEEHLDKIFTPMFTTKAKGMGLGLAVCKRLVEAHNSNITVESKIEEGSTFTVKIPITGG